METIEKRFAQKQAEIEQKLCDSQKQYAALEDEFRMALTIEAKRFSEVELEIEIKHFDIIFHKGLD